MLSVFYILPMIKIYIVTLQGPFSEVLPIQAKEKKQYSAIGETENRHRLGAMNLKETSRGTHPSKSMIHIVYSPYSHKTYKFPPYFHKIYKFSPSHFCSI